MKTLVKNTTFLLAFFYCAVTHAQIIEEHYYTFDTTDTLSQWISSSSIGTAVWKWEVDGKADDGLDWNSRDPIYSASGGGAAVLDVSNHIATSPDTFISLELLLVPNLMLTDTVYLRFTQYYRQHDTSKIAIYLYGDSEVPIDTIPIHSNLPTNVETAKADIQVIKLNDYFDNVDTIKRVGFHYEGTGYFWILDDIGFYEEEPFISTLPAYVGDTLTALGYEWAADMPINAWPYVPNEVVVQFAEGVTEDERQEIRDTLGAIKRKSCVCDKLELWEMTDGIIVPNYMMGDTASIGINEKVKGGSSSSKVQGMDLNKYNYNELRPNLPDSIINFLTILPSNIPISSDTAHLIAILDTGVDYGHNGLTQYIHRNNEILDDLDNDNDTTNCLVDDPIGWNFVDENNNPSDNHGHGTHVAGIVVQRLQENNPNCDFKIIPYKTHDSQGVSNLFDVACATYQAIEDKVDVINDSWGFYGQPSEVLSLAIAEAADSNIVIVASAGNDGVNLNTLKSYPVCETVPNLIGVGSFSMDGDVQRVSSFSNYGSAFIDIVAPGDSILSFIPDNDAGKKTGTSMASPAVAAAAISAICNGKTTIQDIKDCIFDAATVQSDLSNQISGGKILNWADDCLQTSVDEILINISGKVYPNPTTAQLYLELEDIEQPEQVIIYDLMGRVVYQQIIPRNTPLDNYNIPVSHLFKGTYILTLKGNNYIWNAKFIKM